MRILLITPDLNLRDVFGRSLPLGWVLDVVRTAEEAAATIDTQKPDLVVADMVLAGMNGLAFIQALQKRMDWPPATVLVTQSAVDETLHGVALGLKVQEVLCKPVDEETVQRIFAPYQLDDGPLHMSLLEFLVTGYTDMSNRRLDLMAGGHRISLIFGMGYLWAIRHPLFGDRYRNALVAAGFSLPPQGEDDLLDEAAVEERLGPSPQLSALKQHTVLSILASIPLHLTFQGRIADVIIPEGLLPLDVPSVVVPLVEHVPESALSALRTPGLRVGPSPDVIPADLPIQPQQGFVLSLCNGMVPVQQLVQMGTIPEQQILSSVYLLLLLGLLVSDPPAGKPFRLAGLQREMENETQRVRRQITALQSLVANFQTPGRSPYDILGIPPAADSRQAMEAYQLFLDRLSPQRLQPEVYKKHQQDIMFLKAKLSEAFLLLQSSFLDDKAVARDAQAAGSGASPQTRGEQDVLAQRDVQKKEADKMVAMARQLLEEEKPFEAGQCLKLAILYNPSLALAHHLMGRVYMHLKDSRAKHMAERKFLEALQLDPRDMEIQMDLTELYLSQGLLARSRACFTRAQRLDPRHPRILDLRDALKALEKRSS